MRKTIAVFVAVVTVVGLLAGLAWASGWGTYMGYPVARLMVNGQVVTPSSPAIVIKGNTYVPLRFVSEALGARVGWDGQTYTVSISAGSGGSSSVITSPGKRAGKELPKTFSAKGVSVTLASVEASSTETVLRMVVANNTSSDVLPAALNQE